MHGVWNFRSMTKSASAKPLVTSPLRTLWCTNDVVVPVDSWCVRLQRRLRIGDHGQDLEFDVDQRERLVRDLPRERRHQRHAVAEVAHLVVGQDALVPDDDAEDLLAGDVLAVSTASTPGCRLAFDVSIRTMRACGCCERRTWPTS